MKQRTFGFTLVELLVAIGLFGFLLLALGALVQGTLRFSNLNTAMSISIEDISDTEGYLTDTFREAKLVVTNLEILDSGGTPIFNCDPDVNPGRCVGVVSPVVDASQPEQPIVNFDLSVFVVREIESLYESEGLPRGWQGEDTLVLLEYRRSNLCGSPCSSVGDVTLTATNRTIPDPPGFLLGNLSPTNGAGDDVAFFRVPEGASNLLLNFVVRADAVTSNPYVVRQTPVALQVAVRR